MVNALTNVLFDLFDLGIAEICVFGFTLMAITPLPANAIRKSITPAQDVDSVSDSLAMMAANNTA